jgi:hypothetical protein
VSSYWNREGTVILTEAVVEVEDAIVGSTPSHVRVRTFGGQVGNRKIVAHGFPTFVQGERLLLFLEPDASGDQPGFHKVLGYQQGQFRIRTDPSGREVAVPTWEADSIRVLQPDGTTARVPHAVALDELKLQIRETARRVSRQQVAQ